MKEYDGLLRLLDEKKQLLERFEEVSLRMLTCEDDDLEEGMEERGRLIERGDELEAQVRGFCDGAGEPALLRALDPAASRGELPGWAAQFYDAARASDAVGLRLREANIQLHTRLEEVRERTLSLIRESNRGQGAQAAKYYGSMGARGGYPGSQLGRA